MCIGPQLTGISVILETPFFNIRNMEGPQITKDYGCDRAKWNGVLIVKD